MSEKAQHKNILLAAAAFTAVVVIVGLIGYLRLATASTARAEENLRCANLGFREGVMLSTDVMEAQTAWLQAQSQKIDAEIDVKLSQVNLQKALGTLHE